MHRRSQFEHSVPYAFAFVFAFGNLGLIRQFAFAFAFGNLGLYGRSVWPPFAFAFAFATPPVQVGTNHSSGFPTMGVCALK